MCALMTPYFHCTLVMKRGGWKSTCRRVPHVFIARYTTHPSRPSIWQVVQGLRIPPARPRLSQPLYISLFVSKYLLLFLDCLISDTRWETRNGIGQLPPYIVSQWLTDGIWRGFGSFVWQQWVESKLVGIGLQQSQHHFLPNYSEEEINPQD